MSKSNELINCFKSLSVIAAPPLYDASLWLFNQLGNWNKHPIAKNKSWKNNLRTLIYLTQLGKQSLP